MTISVESLGLELSYEAQYQIISLEAMGGADSLRSALTRLPGFFSETSKRLGSLLSAAVGDFWRPKDLNSVAQELAHRPYQELRKKEFPSIPGVKVDYLTYSEALAKDADLCARVSQEVIKPLTSAIALFLSDRDRLASNRPMEEILHISADPYNKQSQATAKLLDPKKHMEVQPYDKLIRRQNDWAFIAKNAGAISQAFDTSDHAAFSFSVERLNDLLSKLMNRVTHQPELYRVSSASLEAISRSAYAAAQAVEFYGLTYKRASAFELAMTRMVEMARSF